MTHRLKRVVETIQKSAAGACAHDYRRPAGRDVAVGGDLDRAATPSCWGLARALGSQSARTVGAVTSPFRGSGIDPGTILAGKYRVDRVLGAGGMGVVLAAYHLELEEPVAIKLMLPEILGNADAVARFLREARAAVKIKSEHIARVSDVGKLDSGEPYIVMEFLEGEDLAGWLAQRGPLSVEQACEFMIQACEALAEAHSLGIIHRDLKPANLFCTRRADGLLSIKVLDFGIAKAATGARSHVDMTKTDTVIGSPLYMSPEQLESARDVDTRGDIWALGVILYELLCGRSPFMAESISGVLMRIVTQSPPRLTQLQPSFSPALEAVIFRCLEKNREQRFRSVGELALALADFAPARSRASAERSLRVLQVAGASNTAGSITQASAQNPSLALVAERARGGGTQATFGNTAAPQPRRRRAVAALVLVGMLAFAILGAELWSRRGLGQPTAAVSAGSFSATTDRSSSRPAAPVPVPPLEAPAELPKPLAVVSVASSTPTIASARLAEKPRGRARPTAAQVSLPSGSLTNKPSGAQPASAAVPASSHAGINALIEDRQ
jgi:serine/threonine protein kinase